MRQIHNLVPGTPEWIAFRAEHDGASEAAAMLGLSRNTKRSELLHMKKVGTVKEFSDFVQKRILDKGHEVEALTRPLVVKEIKEELYPVTLSDGRQSASCDGLTMDEETGWENKQWNEEYAQMVRAGQMPEEHMPQVQQGLKVSGANRWIFSISDGTPERFVWMEVLPDPAWFARIDAGWDQFAKDLASYTPAAINERPQADVIEALPALVIHAKGEISSSNLKEYKEALTGRLREIRAIQLVNDQDFANARESAKMLRESIQKAQLAKEAMLAQTATVGEAATMIEAMCEDMRKTALQLEKDVEREDRAKKDNMILAAKGKMAEHVQDLEAEITPIRLTVSAPVFADAIKGKRNFASMQDAVDTMLANAKIAADAEATELRAKIAWYTKAAVGNGALFPDLHQVIRKPSDDFQRVINERLAAQKQREDEAAAKVKADAEIERIERHAAAGRSLSSVDELTVCLNLAEGWEVAADAFPGHAARVQQAKTEAISNVRSLLEKAKEKAAAAPIQAAAPAPAPSPTGTLSKAFVELLPTGGPREAMTGGPAPITRNQALKVKAPADLKLGVINERLAPLTITAEGMEQLGFKYVVGQRGAKLYHQEDWDAILDAAISHLQKARDLVAA
ncbi:MAG: YqaJ viral recombinase family protein [Pseudomonadota bacterium]